jgi:hypothetical protein
MRFSTNVYSGSNIFPTLFETVGLRVPNQIFRDFNLFLVDLERHNCPARCVSAVNTVSQCRKFTQRKVCFD